MQMIHTAFTRLLGLSAPIQLAALPDIGTPDLIAAVANAGGLGMLGAPMMTAERLDCALDEIAARTSQVIGVNFLMPFLDPACVAVAARRARVVEFFYADPDANLIAEVHAGGALASWQIGSVGEAVAAESAGCDFIVAQGTEAGGHVRGQTSLLPFLAEVLETVRVPVVAAGGMATARALAAVIACGAGGARMGTRFVAAAESAAHPTYVNAILKATAADTCLTEAFSVMWPNAPHRVLRSSIAAAAALPEGVIGSIPLGGSAFPIERFSVVAPTIAATGAVEAMALYAGESVANIATVQPAADIVRDMVLGAELLLRASTE